VTVVALAHWQGLVMSGEGRWLVIPLLVFAAAVAWRDSLPLKASNLLAVLVALALIGYRARRGSLRLGGVAEYLFGLVHAALHAAGGLLVLLVADVNWGEVPRGAWSQQAIAVSRGLAIAIPLTLLFGALFVAADAVFDRLVSNLWVWEVQDLFEHVLFVGLFAWIVAGFLRQLFFGDGLANPVHERPAGLGLGIVELGIVLGMLNALFLAFVLVQFRYLFGGTPVIEASPDLTYAQYARRGFFELVAVAALALPLLLSADWLLRATPGQRRAFRVLEATLIVLLFVVMTSAVQRMRLYTEEFGLTELRIYTTTFMGWLAIVFVWFLATVLRGRRERFTFGALVAAFLSLAALNVANPDALIVRTNMQRAAAGLRFDAHYLRQLSADGIPTLVELLPTLPEQQRTDLVIRILGRWSPPERLDWRTWSLGRYQAWQAVARYEAESGIRVGLDATSR
jgi:hypothetical protein